MASWHAANRRFVDLHAHSTASDGSLSPADLIQLAEKTSLAAVALTDHDTVDGIAEAREAAAAIDGLKFAPGIEISAEPPSGTLHIVGLGIDEHAPSLKAMAETLSQGRKDRNPKIVANLQALGMAITMEDVAAVAREAGGTDDIISRVHIAVALQRAGHVSDKQEAFDKYLATGKAAYVGRTRLSPTDSVAAIHGAGGVAILAHPPQLRCENDAQLQQVVRTLADAGLDGIEAYCPDCDDRMTRVCLDLAKTFNLLVTGGSDFHGAGKPDVRLGIPRTPAGLISDELAERIFE